MKKAANPEKTKAEGGSGIGLLALMLIMFLTALVVCIALAILLFSVMGKHVYAKVVANEMIPRAELLADEAVKCIEGGSNDDTFRFLAKGSEYEIIALDTKQEPISLLEPKQQRKPDEQGRDEPPADEPPAEAPPDEPPFDDRDGSFGRYEELMAPCREIYDKVIEQNGYVKNDGRNGIFVGVPLKNSEEELLGAIFLIKPINDITEVSKSLVIVLVIASLVAALLMVVPIYLMARRLTDPIKKLTKAAINYSNGDLSERVVTTGSGEVSELGHSFNRLADNLQENINELTIERNRLRALLQGMNEGIMAFDMNGGFTKCNNAAAELLTGDEEAEVSSSPELAAICQKAKEAIALKQKTVSNLSCCGSIIRVSIAPVEDENGLIAGAVALLMDVTEAERLEQTRRDYVANVSHELRTPLASIRGIADMLNDGLVKNEQDKHRYYGYILKESIRLSTLINDLLELSRLQSGSVALKLYRMDLSELISDVADRMTASAHERGMRIAFELPEGRCQAYSNPDRMEQVLISLMDNAVKHGTPGCEIRTRLSDAGEKWEISVKNPAEIERKDLDHLFERFYKADIAHSGEGTGLGLAITEETLRLLGETIEVSYENGEIEFAFTVSKPEQTVA